MHLTSAQTQAVEHVAGEGAGPQFPPFDPTTFESQVAWLVITFVLLYVVLSRFVLPRLQQLIGERADRVAADLDDAERLNRETEELKERIHARLADARSRAQAVLQRARQEIRERHERTLSALEERLKAKVAEAEEKIAEGRARVLAELPEIAAEAARELHARIVGEAPEKAALKKAVAEAAQAVRERG